ncbi:MULTISPECIES: DUF4365 domain-containing protein [Bacillus]|uniref:DUF4365 domain-containing protein n=1 Tax=Bacillus TaxID=1386 RepID=UPI00187AC14D|nr:MULTISPECIES: DUF4365 domain-containing protein [Bacillus]MEC1543783.1 DUF4365 domain-containing protein [Bacillus halotolerans]UZD52165.1 DUF4365 domain-containing protein [Bacillus halotolerans]WEY45826.1 DUF4365 domain-containing protein [Bacillus sp. B28]
MEVNLPETTSQHEQEENSITAFRLVIGRSNFIIRDIRQNDYGVDLNIEAKLIGENKKYASNYLCQIQLKDKLNSASIKNMDGTYSYEVKIKSLNYLLNNPSSIFMIYLEDEEIFVWEWANEIQKYALKKNLNLNSTSQKGLTYRFYKELNKENINRIYERIIQIGDNIKKFQKIILESNQNILLRKEKLLSSFDQKNQEIENWIQKKEFEKALKLCSSMANFVEEEEVFIKCSVLSMLSKKYKKTVGFCNRSLKINENNYLIYLIKASAYIELKNYEQAIKSIQKSLSIKETPEGYIQYGILHFALGNYSKAINWLKQVLDLDIENEWALLIIGNIYTALFDYPNALYYLEKVLKINLKNAQALALIGDNYKNQGMYELASEYYLQCLDIEPTNELGLIGLGVSLLANNQHDKGLIYIGKWMGLYQRKKLNKNNGIVLAYIGRENSFALRVTLHKKNQIKVELGKEQEVLLNLPNEYDKIFIGVQKNTKEKWGIPLVGKIYSKNKDFNNVIKSMTEKLDLIRDFPSKGQSIDFYNQTKLYVKEEIDRVYIQLDFNGCIINGYTNGNNKKRGFNAFMKAYKRLEAFQVSLYNEEKNEEVSFVVKGNVLIESL